MTKDVGWRSSIPDVMNPWPKHGEGAAIYGRWWGSAHPRQAKMVGVKCQAGSPRSNCCLFTTGTYHNDRGGAHASLSYSYAGTPSTPSLLRTIATWTTNCSTAPAADVVVLGLTDMKPESTEMILTSIEGLISARRNMTSTAYFLMTVTAHSDLSAALYEQHEVFVMSACARARQRTGGTIISLPVSSATSSGMFAHTLHHERGSNWHFEDPGRIYLAEVILNALDMLRRTGGGLVTGNATANPRRPMP